MTTNGKKNIVLLIADDLGRDISCYNAESPAKTPHLAALAQDGTRFTHGFTSTASCSPSRTVVYTGLHTHTNGNYGLSCGWNPFGTFSHIDTAPKIFNSLGYVTGIVGKVHVGPAEVYPWAVREESGSRDVAWVADRAEAVIGDALSANKPFFLTIGYIDPHRDMAERGGFGNKPSGYDSRIHDKEYRSSEVAIPTYLSDLPEVRTEVAEYYRSINRLDQGIGLVLGKLRLLGVADDTLVIFLSDNGPPFVNSKTTLYDAGIHLPLIIRQPGISGVVNPNMVSWVDILPTMLDWAGHAELNEADRSARRGRSLLPIMSRTQRLPDWTKVFGSHTFHEISNFWPTRFVRNGRFKYHRNVAWKLDFPFAADLYASLSWDGMRNSANANGGSAMIGPRRLKDFIRRPPEELYDLDNDPAEVNSLVNDPQCANVLVQMRSDLEKWQADTEDPFLWRDGISTLRMEPYVRNGGLRVPDRWDFDIDSPGNTEGSMLSFPSSQP